MSVVFWGLYVCRKACLSMKEIVSGALNGVLNRNFLVGYGTFTCRAKDHNAHTSSR